ncbi:hypothetical protein [Frondihabitans sp. Leaf304]|uniref:hypothetical protein n=1 Tax=Frondihabitans sp. Leaf304 TaxID=1736329 RepID=UPI0006F1E90C|nr:hypothetical protein [Frondihabitans sp. Leaf304]KQQ27509.1 hypothetical protein ASF54_01530 [Frondihabitans sp. Leaf304]
MSDDEPYVPLNRRPNPDLVSYGPTNDDSPGFTIGLWATEALLFAVVLGGFTVLRLLGDLVNVVTALASMLLFVALYAIILRGRLRKPSRSGSRYVLRILAVVLVLAAVVATTLLGVRTAAGTPTGELVLPAVGTWVLGQAALVAAYFSRMFRSLAEGADPRGRTSGPS